MIAEVLSMLLHLLAAIAAAAILAFGFVFLIFVGDANAHGRALVSRRLDWVAMLAVYLSWFGLLWRFGFSEALLMAACAATIVLCLIYAASYRTAMARRSATPL